MDDPRGPPPAPSAPDPADCCGEGCGNCVFDQYQAAMRRWHLQLTRRQEEPPLATAGATGSDRRA